ncbi:RsiV family protein [Intestinimonas butyriciproducens]|uniref:RsiV family protein n=2 Tax=Intestinimonas butyriciproducens TaxID=1297617 RepID=UPI00189E41A6|nr:RsiV family protein [Intestinimonas butyriciproducens]
MWKSQHWTQTLEHEGEPVLSLSQALPLPVEERRPDRRMERYYRHLGELWKNRWAAVLYPRACAALQEARAGSRPFLPWEAELVYHVTLERDGLSSLYVDVTERQNGTRPLTVRTAETWELRSGTPKTLSEFFPPRLFWKKPIIEALQHQALDRLQGGESLLFEDVETRVASYFSTKRFYLTEEGLSLFYPMWSLGSPAEGIPAFLLPLPTSLQKLSPEKS